jgi:hypothetical protein
MGWRGRTPAVKFQPRLLSFRSPRRCKSAVAGVQTVNVPETDLASAPRPAKKRRQRLQNSRYLEIGNSDQRVPTAPFRAPAGFAEATARSPLIATAIPSFSSTKPLQVGRRGHVIRARACHIRPFGLVWGNENEDL